ncbi:bifunctional 5,10-methylenetetrahydrofolate dehydrogenase/5,10-methenyltetrahydrofolate cyclohydrolase [Fructobacillus sp. M1-13]|uniref:Bifunctional protein FolD n=1 Tax=Fructobacillus papyriferae TaxID=2713171 RepID=A0ABS5QRS6_9LACO|nr:bifunctional 5,10-methylenetetrahydrofolate dehydrogenase/5,10-methenyltetrahydrofolate cyclohydrolase [Fructobacillus papyriferae]MBS9335101.1 bifunctional 5,10-methylenetetrahydrofolate dehydrogenase/5,10-methenyltetrahydrofolate cyclohydrolase [Fructobacillus papyriferae]MCD2159413.1 bifunctional 5,10-methylenetetrahydrofolate dehydrogenase/5,10-methenyltetrahydrofolate cyclohydrolase [Fructobacillus papyriferae]
MVQILDGKAVAKALREQLTTELAASGLKPTLAVVFDPADDGSRLYVGMKQKAAAKVGIETRDIAVSADATTESVEKIVAKLNQDASVSGILIQAPLPKEVDDAAIFAKVAPEKDVDGLGVTNQGRLFANEAGNYPVAATPKGVMTLLNYYDIDPRGKRAVVVGRSQLFGRPMAALLLNADATVTVAHRYTKEETLNNLLAEADIIVVGVGIPGFIKASQIKEGAVVIDVGMNLVDGKACGDVEAAAADKAGWLTPVPGGVGPMTIATLLESTMEAALEQAK